ncbi:hypothetical protein BGZ65_002705 [Modicella reniformis]|uniref:tRNA-specific adenosine deaminase 1 n=1 Tax=Modicella reniformis TaxID=1440133 RepID=A0A9P6J0V9_9FUNG|nr:hypothetical protein BGZ65_002705 [Modicella reniformis]
MDRRDKFDGVRYQLHPIQIYETSLQFEFSKEGMTLQSEKEGISWIASEPLITEVLVNGCKAGASSKQPIQSRSRSRLCKVSMFKSSVDLWKTLPESAFSKLEQYSTLNRVLRPSESEDDGERNGNGVTQENTTTTYGEWKGLAKEYNEAKKCLLANAFQNWVRGDKALAKFNIHGDLIVV